MPPSEPPKGTHSRGKPRRNPSPRLGQSHEPPPPRPPAQRPGPTPPHDTKGDREFQRADRFKRTPQYKRDVRAAYDAQPEPQRSQVARHVNPRTPEGRAIAPIHAGRVGRNRELARAQAQHDVPTNRDLQRAARYEAIQRQVAGLRGIPQSHGVIGKLAGVAAAPIIGLSDLQELSTRITQEILGLKHRGGPHGAADVAEKVAENAARDIVDIPANTIPSLYHTARTTIEQGPVAGAAELAAPFVETIRHPVESFVNHPLGTGLMFSGLEGAIGRGAGKAMRTLPGPTRQLARTEAPARTATVPGTPLTEPRPYSKNVIHKAVAVANERVRGTNTTPAVMTDKQIARRVDEYVSAHGRDVLDTRTPGIDYVHEFAVRRPESDGPHIFASKAAAVKAARNLPVPMRAVRVPHGNDGHVLIPAAAMNRIEQHQRVNQPPATAAGAAALSYSKAFRKTVLATSPKWIAGNVIEAATRALVAHAGPRSLATGAVALRKLKREDPAAYEQARARMLTGGHGKLTGDTAHAGPLTRDAQYAGSRLAKLATAINKAGDATGLRHVWHAYTNIVFDQLNGRIERSAQTAMLGKALRDSPLMSNKTVKLSNRAIEQAARGMRDTETQVQLGREIDRMFGQYSKFSPAKRQAIANYTPFIAWTLNAYTFLRDVLPQDHPVLTSMLASLNENSEEWRDQFGLVFSLMGGDRQAPSFLQGSIPGEDGTMLRVSRYTPFGVASNPLGVFADAVLPQIMGVVHNVGEGENWQGRSLEKGKNGDDVSNVHRALAAAVTLIENTVPFSRQAHVISGLELPNDAPGSTHNDETAGERARRQFDPFQYTRKPKKRGGKRTGGQIPSLVPGGGVSPLQVQPLGP